MREYWDLLSMKRFAGKGFFSTRKLFLTGFSPEKLSNRFPRKIQYFFGKNTKINSLILSLFYLSLNEQTNNVKYSLIRDIFNHLLHFSA